MFIEAKDDGGGGNKWTTGAISRAKLQSNLQHQQTNIQFFYRPDALPVAQPTMSKHWREQYLYLYTEFSMSLSASGNVWGPAHAGNTVQKLLLCLLPIHKRNDVPHPAASFMKHDHTYARHLACLFSLKKQQIKRVKTGEIGRLVTYRNEYIQSKFSSGLLDFCDKLAAEMDLYLSTTSKHPTSC